MKIALTTILLSLITFNSYAAISESELDTVINRFKDIYSSSFLEATYKDLIFFKDFRKKEVRAYIEQKSLFYRITLEKGLIDAPEMTSDAAALIICHELGHALGGDPVKKTKTFNNQGEEITDYNWASAEGQSDYYATSVCMKKYFEGDYNTDYLWGKEIPNIILNRCSQSYTDEEDVAICIRTALAIPTVTEVINRNNEAISLLTPDLTESETTLLSYPALQCRMDTYFNGALGLERPRCWYKPGHSGNASWKF